MKRICAGDSQHLSPSTTSCPRITSLCPSWRRRAQGRQMHKHCNSNLWWRKNCSCTHSGQIHYNTNWEEQVTGLCHLNDRRWSATALHQVFHSAINISSSQNHTSYFEKKKYIYIYFQWNLQHMFLKPVGNRNNM